MTPTAQELASRPLKYEGVTDPNVTRQLDEIYKLLDATLPGTECITAEAYHDEVLKYLQSRGFKTRRIWVINYGGLAEAYTSQRCQIRWVGDFRPVSGEVFESEEEALAYVAAENAKYQAREDKRKETLLLDAKPRSPDGCLPLIALVVTPALIYLLS